MIGWLSKKLKTFDAWLQKQQSVPDLSATLKFADTMKINTFDCDGVVHISPEVGGVYPGPYDVIITGRSYQERPETQVMLLRRKINNDVYYNPVVFEAKTREGSGRHKAGTIKKLQAHGYTVKAHFEDDPVQADVIRKLCPEVKVIMLVHDLTVLENVRRDRE